MPNSDYKYLTYKDAATALSTSVETVRVQARRNHWPKRKNNQNKITIGVPIERINNIETNSEIVSKNDQTNYVHELQQKIAVLSIELKHANEKIETLNKQTDDLKIDRDAWRNQAQAKRFWFWRRAG